MSDHNITRISNTAVEQVISTDRCRLTVTVRDDSVAGGSNVKHIAAAGLPQAGKTFSQRGVRMSTGLTVQLSSATDDVAIVWAPKFS
jgi:hypothetical protein